VSPRDIGRGPTLALLGAELTPMVAVAAGRLGWKVSRVAGEVADELRRETGARTVGVDELLTDPRADLVVVGSGTDVRTAHVERLVSDGRAVVVAPGVTWDDTGPGWATVGEPFVTAPVVQRWYREVAALPTGSVVRNLSGRGGDDPTIRWSLAANLLLTARLAGRSGLPRPIVGPAREWELQLATDDVVLHVRMQPEPTLERNGERIDVPSGAHPAEAFGVTGLLRLAWDDLVHGRPPTLGAAFAADVAEVLAA
jgi:hypothetical protein